MIFTIQHKTTRNNWTDIQINYSHLNLAIEGILARSMSFPEHEYRIVSDEGYVLYEHPKWIETKRIYIYPSGKVEIENVVRFCVSPSGEHQLETRDGGKWIVLPGFLAVQIEGTTDVLCPVSS